MASSAHHLRPSARAGITGVPVRRKSEGPTPRLRSRVASGVVLAVVAASGLAVILASPVAATACGLEPAYTVPAGVHHIDVRVRGGAGQPGFAHTGRGGGAGGLGAEVRVRYVAVTPGQGIYAGTIQGGEGGGQPTGIIGNGAGPDVGRGGEGTWVSAGSATGGCGPGDDGLIAVAGGGGGGGDGDGEGPGGTGGNAGAAGNPGGNNQDTAGGGGGAGTETAGGAGGVGGWMYDPSCFCRTRRDSGTAGTRYDLPTTVGSLSLVGGEGALGWSGTQAVFGGGGGGGLWGGGGGGTDGGYVSFKVGAGAGGGGGGGSYPSEAATPTTLGAGIDFTPIYDTTTTVESSANPSPDGASVTFTAHVATVDSDQLLGGGVVSFSDLGDLSDPGRQAVSLGTAAVSALGGTGSASLTVPDLGPGPHQIRAFYHRYDAWDGTTQRELLNDQSVGVLTQHIQSAQAITFTSTPGDRVAFGPTYTPTASTTSGLPVIFSIDPASTDVCTISGGTVSFLAAGMCTIDADQSGNDRFLDAPQRHQDITVLPGDAQVIAFTSSPPDGFQTGDSYILSATGGGSGQPVVFSLAPGSPCVLFGSQLIAVVGGSCVVHADQAGGNGYSAAARVDQAVTVNASAQTVIFTSTAPEAPAVGDSYQVRAMASSGQSVTLSLDPASTGCTLTGLSQFDTRLGYYEARGTVTYTGRGTCVVDGDQSGALPRYAPAPQAHQQSTVAGASQVVTFTSTDPAAPAYGDTFTMTADGGGSPSPVRFTSSTPQTCTVDGAVVSFVDVGACTVAADQAGDDTYAPAPTVTTTMIVHPAALTITAPTDTYVHGAVPSTFTPSYSGLAPGDTAASLAVRPTCSRQSSSQDIGIYTVTCTGATDARYEIGYVPGTATVVPAPLTITASSATITYGTPVPRVFALFDGLRSDDAALATGPTCGTTATGHTGAGEYASTCHGAADPNYQISYVPGTVVVDKAPLTVTSPTANRAYGTANPTFTPTYSGFVGQETPAVLTTAPTCTTSADATSPVGHYAVTCTGTQAANYAITSVPGDLLVTRAVLTVRATSLDRVFGAPNPALGYTVSGYANNESSSVLSGAPSLSTTATISSHPAGYPITIDTGTLEAANYSFAFVNGTLSVAKAAVAVQVPVVSATTALKAMSITFSATVRNATTGALVPGIAVSFAAVTSSKYPVACAATTTGAGTATCTVKSANIAHLKPPTAYQVRTAGTPDYLAGTGSAAITR